jgi:hypothetical protein
LQERGYGIGFVRSHFERVEGDRIEGFEGGGASGIPGGRSRRSRISFGWLSVLFEIKGLKVDRAKKGLGSGEELGDFEGLHGKKGDRLFDFGLDQFGGRTITKIDRGGSASSILRSLRLIEAERESMLQSRVPSVLDRVTGSPFESLGYCAPAMAVGGDIIHDDLVLFFSPWFLSNLWIHVVVPSLSALSSDSSRELLGDFVPVSGSIGQDFSQENGILVLSPSMSRLLCMDRRNPSHGALRGQPGTVAFHSGENSVVRECEMRKFQWGSPVITN